VTTRMMLSSRSSLSASQTGCVGTARVFFKEALKNVDGNGRRRRLSFSLSSPPPTPFPLQQTNEKQSLFLPGHDQAHTRAVRLHPGRPGRSRRPRRRTNGIGENRRVCSPFASEAREGPLRGPFPRPHAHQGARLPDRRFLCRSRLWPQAREGLRGRGRPRREAAGGAALAGEAARRRRDPGPTRSRGSPPWCWTRRTGCWTAQPGSRDR
jgi:hypothetical protein